MYDSLHNAAEDLEAGTTRKPKFQTEPTLPIYLKVFSPFQVVTQVIQVTSCHVCHVCFSSPSSGKPLQFATASTGVRSKPVHVQIVVLELM